MKTGGFSSCSRSPTGQQVISLQQEKLKGKSLLCNCLFYPKFRSNSRYSMQTPGRAPAREVPKPLTAGSRKVTMHDMFFCRYSSLKPSAAAHRRNRLD